ncbi:hypothetical protein SAMN02927924_04474 [Sphingobium faniae]|nr:hypothetical protein SAMN02927924_04474 [Sphingobium faniae]
MIVPGVSIVRLGAGDADSLLSIYEEALPPEERKSANAIRQCLSRTDYHILGARTQSGRLLGFAIFFVSCTQPVALLEYLATDGAFRGGGVGTSLFKAGMVVIEERCLLIEVDSDRATTDPRAPARRRQLFYQRLGCQSIGGIDYHMPQVNIGQPPPMDLLIHRNGREGPITNAELHLWLSDIFLLVYDRPSADAEIDRMIGGAEGLVVIS